MAKIKKIFFSFLLIFSLFFASGVSARDKTVNLYFFYGDGCPHCKKEEDFLTRLEKEKSEIRIYRYEVWKNPDNARTLSTMSKEMKLNVSGVPLLFVGDSVLAGFFDDETSGKAIREAVEKYQKGECPDPVGNFLGVNADTGSPEAVCEHNCEAGGECSYDCSCSADQTVNKPEKIRIPLLGEIDPKSFSLPILTIIIGGLDGFNPCATWVLLFLISLLLGIESRVRRWTLGIAFLFVSSAVYFVFLAAWLKFFLVFGFVFWVRILVAVFAVGAGIYNLKKNFNKSTGCEVAGDEKRKAIFEKLKNIVKKKSFWLALLGVTILAASVNLIELLCSAGLPAVYVQMLSLSELAIWRYYAYLLLYIFVFMLDDILIFVIAMATLELVGVSTKYGKAAGIIGGAIMIIIGFLLLLKPGWLMFG